ncbi:MAG: hypothetical protein D6785_07980 [Planctomycetota bacterium]|nr:MAG: hypothetical protein D6785_07980 [Planctomycetota bacterium]
MNYNEQHAYPDEVRVLDYTPVAHLDAQARLAFYRKVYSLFFLGFLVLTGFAFLGLELIRQGALPLQFIYGGAIVLMVLSWFSNRAIQSRKAGLAMMFFYAAIAGLTIAPLLAIAIVIAVGKGIHPFAIVGQAFGLTTLAFGGLTAYVFITKEDFSYLGGFLAITGMVFLGLVIAVWVGLIQLTGTFDLIFTLAMIGFISLSVLYDTSNIIHYFGEEHTVFAAFQLLMSFFVMLWYILRLLLILSSDR